MLSKNALILLRGLEAALGEPDKFKIVEPADISELPVGELPALLDELSIENCVSVKYADGDEFCLSLTKRGAAVLEESRVIDLEAVKDAKLKFSPNKKPAAVLRTEGGGIALPFEAEPAPKRGVRSFFTTFIAAFLGALFGGGIWFIVNLLV